MADTSIIVARLGEIQPGCTKKFCLHIDGREEECFAVNHRGKLYAYVNRRIEVRQRFSGSVGTSDNWSLRQ